MSPGVGLEAVGLHRSFGATPALEGVDLSLEPGAFATIFGPNGAGKSTLLGVLSGAVRPDAGTVHIAGRAMLPRDPEWPRSVGVLSHHSHLYGDLSARENLTLYGTLFGLASLRARIEESAEALEIVDVLDRRVRGLSRGTTQRVALARTLLHEPPIVLLDEPSTGLDPHAAGRLLELLRSLRDGRRTVVLVTHDLRLGLALADRTLILVRGRIARAGPVRDRDPGRFEAAYRSVVEAGAPPGGPAAGGVGPSA